MYTQEIIHIYKKKGGLFFMSKEIIIEKMANELSYEKQKIFLLLLLERVFCCYKKHSEGKKWDCTKHFNQIIEDCWDHMINGTEYEYMMDSEEDPDHEEWEDELYGHSPDVMIMNDEAYDKFHPPYGNIVILSRIVEDIYITFRLMAEEISSRPTFLGELGANFSIIEEFIDEYYKDIENDDLFENHELICLEFEREKRDIEYLKQEDDLKKIYQKYRFEMNESLLEDYWFEEEYL